MTNKGIQCLNLMMKFSTRAPNNLPRRTATIITPHSNQLPRISERTDQIEKRLPTGQYHILKFIIMQIIPNGMELYKDKNKLGKRKGLSLAH